MDHAERLHETNFLLYAAKNYNDYGLSSTEEFIDDLNVFKYILRLLNRYKETGEIQERLLLNHIIITYNIWGIPAATRMLFYKNEEHVGVLTTFLVYLSYMPLVVQNIGPTGKNYKYDEIVLDLDVMKRLQAL